MSLLIYEHITGGGYANNRIPPNILSEGYAMSRALISDFKASGYNVITLLDSRLKIFNPQIEADKIVPVSSNEELTRSLKKFSQAVDGVYVIAPESDNVLQNLVKTVELSGGNSLNCRVDAIAKASNKMIAYEILKKNGISVPETLIVDLHENIKQIKRIVGELGFPLVFKPLDGVGCYGLSVVRKESEISAAIAKIIKESSREHFIAQRLIKGVAASVSLISTDDEALPITLNKQIITLAPPSSASSYTGGTVPFHHQLEKKALKAAEMAVKSLTGLRGYVGVDMVLSCEEPVIIEINPRLTTSYIGLRKVANFNPAQAIVDAVHGQRLPRDVHISGYASFLKVTLCAPTLGAVSRTYGLNDVLSPPFPITEDGMAYTLLVSYATKLRETKIGLNKAKKNLLGALSGGD